MRYFFLVHYFLLLTFNIDLIELILYLFCFLILMGNVLKLSILWFFKLILIFYHFLILNMTLHNIESSLYAFSISSYQILEDQTFRLEFNLSSDLLIDDVLLLIRLIILLLPFHFKLDFKFVNISFWLLLFAFNICLNDWKVKFLASH